MISFDWKKNIENSIKDGLNIATTTIRIFLFLWQYVKLPKTFLGTMDTIELAGGINGRVIVKNYVVYKKCINDWLNNNIKILWLHFFPRPYRCHEQCCQYSKVCLHIVQISSLKILPMSHLNVPCNSTTLTQGKCLWPVYPLQKTDEACYWFLRKFYWW